VHVPFQGGPPAVTSTVAGHTHVLHLTLPIVAPMVRDGKLRLLAIADKTRAADLHSNAVLGTSLTSIVLSSVATALSRPKSEGRSIGRISEQRCLRRAAREDHLFPSILELGAMTDMLATP
jgi:Tripartite tricarboxylate transporter family receptor